MAAVWAELHRAEIWLEIEILACEAQAEFGHIPVVMVTSKSTESDKFWASQQGADGYVAKPFTAADLVGAVRKFIG